MTITIATKFHNAKTRTKLYQVISDTQVAVPRAVRKRLCGSSDCRCELRITESADPEVLQTAFVHTR